MKSRLDFNSIINGISIAVIYLLFDRSINLHVISSNSIVNSVFSLISEGAFILVCLYYIANIVHFNNIRYYYVGILFVFIGFAGILLISTSINNGNVHRWFSSVYPTIGSLLFMSIYCKNIEKTKRFINAVSNLYCLLLTINLFLMILMPDHFGANYYFAGFKNQIAITLTFGFFYTYFDYYLNCKKAKFYLYVIIHIITAVLTFSSGGLICMAFIYLCFFVKPVGRMIASLPLTYMIAFFAVVLFLIASGSISVLLNLPAVKYVIVDILGKNLTLTNRVFIWDRVINMLSGHFILGMGVADTYNLFYVHQYFSNRADFVGTYSAHNQFLQTLYEGGIISVGIMLLAAVMVSRKLKKVSDINISKVVKIATVAIIIVLFDEAAGFISYFQIVQMSSLMAYVFTEKYETKVEKNAI